MTSFHSWVSDDEHAGGMVGLMLGVVFLVIGSCILAIREKGFPVPMWRKLTGIIILLLGGLSFIAGCVFVAQDE